MERKMDLRQLRCFLAVAETLSYRDAAERLGISAPPLYKHVNRLQSKVGAPLFNRRERKLELTKAGQLLFAEVSGGLERLDRAVARARQEASRETELSIGYNSVAECSVFSHVISAFRKVRPDVNLTCRNMRTPEQVEALERNKLDLGFICPPVAGDALDIHVLTQQPFVVVLPAKHRLAAASSVSFRQLSGEPMVVCSRALDPDSFRQLQGEFDSAGAVLNVVCELESAQAMIRFAATGNGCCVVPEYASQLVCAGVVAKRIDSSKMMRVLAVANKKGREGLAQSFCEFAVMHVNEMNASAAPPRTQRPALAAVGIDNVRARR
jgi:DNA-binding transcriptional LysR family regulator